MPAARPIPALPIDDAIPAVRDALTARGAAVLQAPPGAGKTTHVPLALLAEPWLAGRKILMLEPRRLAARAAARRMAALLGESVGERVGYRTRLDTRVGPTTRIEVVTEGVLTRMLQRDPGLEDTALLIFDEFHERSIHADVGLALALFSRDLLRPELRLLVMSATLDAAPVSELLGGAPVVSSQARQWPVDIHWAGTPPPRGLEAATTAVVRRVLEQHGGDLLVFLPGRAEIHRVERLLATVPADIDVLALYGDLPPAAQDRAIQPSPPGRRKIVLATSIAETSLTIEGVNIVVDAGLSRVPRFSARTGMSRLETVRVSRAAAEQRAGRAGRLGPGVCYRLWSAGEHGGLVPRHRPEILEADLAPLALDLAAAGVADPGELRWLDPPPAAALEQARELLRALGAFDADGRITPHGRAVAQLPMHPRLAHLVLRAEQLGLGATGAALAALLEERDLLGGDGPPDADVRRRLELVLTKRPSGAEPVRRDVLERVRATAERWGRLAAATGGADAEQAGVLLSFAYPDRIGKLRGGTGRYLLRNGRGAWLDPADPLAREPWIVAGDISDAGAEGRIHRAAPISIDEVVEHHGDQITRHDEIEWDQSAACVRGRYVERLGAIVMRETSISNPPPELVVAALLGEIAKRGIAALPWSAAAEQFRRRVEFMQRLEPERWPDLSDAALSATLDAWLAPHLTTARGFDDIAALDLVALLRARLAWRERIMLDEQAPTHVVVPSGSRVPIDYSDAAAPAIDVRLQEMFGAADSPRIAGGRVPLTLRLLSPARRPLQVTRDLAGFWKGSYAEVRKEMRGRYPKHEWPEDPLRAAPTSRAKPRPRG